MSESNVTIEEANNLIQHGLDFIKEKDYPKAADVVCNAYKAFRSQNNTEGVSASLSLMAFLSFSQEKENVQDTLSLLEDATFMAERSESTTAKLVNELVKGNINFAQDIKDIALLHYNNALKLSSQEDKYGLSSVINTRIKQLQNGMDYSLPTQTDPLVSLVKISRSITALTDIDELLKVIAEETKNAMQADRCTVFLWE